ncbi:hypothetical protein FE391_35550 [Nonomuraea sp. KC401]|uniref:hypothetical protein n=1 Tax=unclassified Nonomuraea TaxID=2593643 RepID=UPI0010FE5332|nr:MULTISPECIES: hypothetical protein [unclassified Nonomuraea]NBE99288.1 hypothetical protein [Nonomuraea sp. K271]TLF58978.1 hypothetical protein FE391_35550 [Nonomuraea sp. KC401]
MWTRMVSGLGLMASGPIYLAGSMIRSASCDLLWAAGAWLAVAATALVYRDMAGPAVGRARALAAVAMALLGVVASAGTVEATLRAAGGLAPHAVTLLALVCGAAAGVAGLAYAAGRAGLIPAAAGVVAAVAALLGTLTADPGAPYLLGAVPLGAGLLAETIRSRSLKGPAS